MPWPSRRAGRHNLPGFFGRQRCEGLIRRIVCSLDRTSRFVDRVTANFDAEISAKHGANNGE